MSQLTELSDAIRLSQLHNENISVNFLGDESELISELHAICDGDLDSVRDNNGTIDVWGCTPKMEKSGKTDWRLSVTLRET